jgi:preprotein translocase subunit SecG
MNFLIKAGIASVILFILLYIGLRIINRDLQRMENEKLAKRKHKTS